MICPPYRIELISVNRYYSDAVLALLQRTCAVEEWSSLQRGHEVSLERALAAFDMFVLQQRKGDFDEVGQNAPFIRNEELFTLSVDIFTTRSRCG